MVADIEVVSEREEASGWRFEIDVHESGDETRRMAVSMAWADYNLWSASGSDEPAAVVRAVVRFLIDRSGFDGVKARFDAALARRMHADADDVIPGLIGDAGRMG
jgi:hypothetical protein